MCVRTCGAFVSSQNKFEEGFSTHSPGLRKDSERGGEEKLISTAEGSHGSVEGRIDAWLCKYERVSSHPELLHWDKDNK